ncbi:MAG: hypothetical protein LBC56_04490 [Oscillospiraceae bacterium]|jgi:hypothetical protein|nr:hypothetical protein [Oscillospiraceae bacterium]
MENNTEAGTLKFKDRPLVRSGDLLYYGNPNDKFIVRIDIIAKKRENNLERATKVSVELLDISGKREKTVKKSERHGLYDALDIGGIWLDRSLSEHKKAPLRERKTPDASPENK